MSNVAVDVLLVLGVAAELICCVGVVAMRTPFDRLHYAAAGATVGPFAIAAAVIVREGLSTQGLQTILAVGILFFLNPVVVHGTARAARRLEERDVRR